MYLCYFIGKEQYFTGSRPGGNRSPLSQASIALSGPDDTTLLFEGRFESGNLMSAYRMWVGSQCEWNFNDELKDRIMMAWQPTGSKQVGFSRTNSFHKFHWDTMMIVAQRQSFITDRNALLRPFWIFLWMFWFKTTVMISSSQSHKLCNWLHIISAQPWEAWPRSITTLYLCRESPRVPTSLVVVYQSAKAVWQTTTDSAPSIKSSLLVTARLYILTW